MGIPDHAAVGAAGKPSTRCVAYRPPARGARCGHHMGRPHARDGRKGAEAADPVARRVTIVPSSTGFDALCQVAPVTEHGIGVGVGVGESTVDVK